MSFNFCATPFIPTDKTSTQFALKHLAMQLLSLSAGGSEQELGDRYLDTKELLILNAYSSIHIEGGSVSMADVRDVYVGRVSSNHDIAFQQHESHSHMRAQLFLMDSLPDLKTLFDPNFIQRVHFELYRNLTEDHLYATDESGCIDEKMIPGKFRNRPVIVGDHIPPDVAIDEYMSAFCQVYAKDQASNHEGVIAVMAAHHRLAWVHPFLDGNGRLGRLITSAALEACGVNRYVAWSLNSVLHQSVGDYMLRLANADQPRQGDYDGRGQLTEKGLAEFCQFMLIAMGAKKASNY